MNKEIDVRVQISHGDMVNLRSPQSQLVRHLTRDGATKIELLQALVIIAGGPPPPEYKVLADIRHPLEVKERRW